MFENPASLEGEKRSLQVIGDEQSLCCADLLCLPFCTRIRIHLSAHDDLPSAVSMACGGNVHAKGGKHVHDPRIPFAANCVQIPCKIM